jgi:quinol monooxygenase YgiN
MTSPETTITVTTGTEQVTLVNVFTVEPQRQDELVAALERATTTVFATVPGFISANLHVSLDGTRVVNYAQWASEAAYRAAMAQPDVREHVVASAALVESYDPTLVQVRAIHHPRQH